MVYRGIYRDDGLVQFTGRQTTWGIAFGLKGYQHLVNAIAEGKYLQFTTKLWNPPNTRTKVTISMNNKMMYLSMQTSGSKCTARQLFIF
eukprot:14026808-Ditylum_brightwellii.AAC.1